MIELAANRYGKAAIRLVRVARGPQGHRLRDLTVAIALEGDFEAAHTDAAFAAANQELSTHLVDGSLHDYVLFEA